MLAYSSNVDTVLTGSRCTRSALVHCLVFRAGRLKREIAFLFIGSWMELVPSNITAVWYFVYWSLLRVSTDHTVSLTDSSITVCKFRFNRSQEMFWEMDSPYHVTLVQGREIAAWTIFEQKNFLHDANASQLCVGYTESKFFRHACSGPAIIHFLKAAVFSVSPTTPLQLFTIMLFIGLIYRHCWEAICSLSNNPVTMVLKFLDNILWKVF